MGGVGRGGGRWKGLKGKSFTKTNCLRQIPVTEANTRSDRNAQCCFLCAALPVSFHKYPVSYSSQKTKRM